MKKFVFLCTYTVLIVLIGAAPLISGCSSRRTTTETTTEVHRDPDNGYVSNYDRGETVEVTKTEKVTQESNHKGFFGIVGDIIALPFRAIGSIL